MDINFSRIAPRGGSQSKAFEELCCQIARRTAPNDSTFARIEGAGGDGGVECYADCPDGSRVGWQAKFVSDVDSLLPQLTDSLTTAIGIHTSLARYVVCFPFDLTGPTGRRGRSGREKFDAWRDEQLARTASSGRRLEIVDWGASTIRDELVAVDANGGMREYFFNETILSREWFQQHLLAKSLTAGPRYTPVLSVETDFWQWFEAFGTSPAWSSSLDEHVRECLRHSSVLSETLEDSEAAARSVGSPWPSNLRDQARTVLFRLTNILVSCRNLLGAPNRESVLNTGNELDQSIIELRRISDGLAEDLEARHGKGKADSVGFRQFMAEYQCEFPAGNLDRTREAMSAVESFSDWLRSPNGRLGFNRSCVITGVAGSGKTHCVCDTANRRFEQGHLSCISYGHEFGGEPDPWTRLRENLGLPPNLGQDALLDALNAAGEESGEPLIVFLDAVNETRPLRYWNDRLPRLIHAIEQRPFLRLCVTCRTSYVPYCLPDTSSIYCAEHRGFAGREQVAALEFFHHYGLEPLVTPILQPELANPLYLKLICETARAQGLTRLPAGWLAIVPAINAFLNEKEEQFVADHQTSIAARTVARSLLAVARELASSQEAAITWSKAQDAILRVTSGTAHLHVLEWLVRADLLIEDVPESSGDLDEESTVRPAFERLGDFLVAQELLSPVSAENVRDELQIGGRLDPYFKDAETVGRNNGIVSALSILLPEKLKGTGELPDFINDSETRETVLWTTLHAIPWRDPVHLSASTAKLVEEGLGNKEFSYDAMDAALAIGWQPSPLDAIWLDNLLRQQPLALRDAYWCGYLHQRYENGVTVRRLIDAAFELPLEQLKIDFALRWVMILLWFTAAADRRVKDRATRAVVSILRCHSRLCLTILDRLMKVDDDAVRERVLLTVYGALLLSRDMKSLRDVCKWLGDRIAHHPDEFVNALIRDHSRALAEFAHHAGAWPDEYDLRLFSQRLGSDWPLILPTETDIKEWEALPKLVHSCLRDDFFRYTISCLRDWEYAVPRVSMAQWILRQVAHTLGYADSECARYDRYMLGSYGAGRGRPSWAERIGKKYQWIAMFQLAACLADKAKRKRDRWSPKPRRKPFILLEERQLDPTLPANICDEEREAGAWWVNSAVDLRKYAFLCDEEWARQEDDLPDLDRLIGPFEQDNRKWFLLGCTPTWGDREDDSDVEPYRFVRVDLAAYLVPRRHSKLVFAFLKEKNLCGSGLPEGSMSLYGFAAEYPWATPFNIEPDSYLDPGGSPEGLPCRLISASNQLCAEWQYDASLARQPYVQFPTRAFFKPRDLWWNGRDGFSTDGGIAAFRDPSLTTPGPRALVADGADLLQRLAQIRKNLIFTFIGEKMLLGGDLCDRRPYRTFSQVARMRSDGSLELSRRIFFDEMAQES